MVRFGIPWIRHLVVIGTWWVERQERRILRDGFSLTDEEKIWAARVGVVDVDKVRLLLVNRVPMLGSPFIYRLFDPIGLTAGYGIYIDRRSQNDPSLLVHELVHVAQYERMGGIRNFLTQYVEECVRFGYWDSDMEHEARIAALPFNRPPEC